MKIKTSDLSGTALDWAVAKCEFAMFAEQNDPIKPWVQQRHDEGDPCMSPSTNWAHGGPIIDREKIDIRNTFTEGGYRTAESVDAVHAAINLPNGATVFSPGKAVWEYGPTPLIAAMRCYVASKLGDEIDIPDCLI